MEAGDTVQVTLHSPRRRARSYWATVARVVPGDGRDKGALTIGAKFIGLSREQEARKAKRRKAAQERQQRMLDDLKKRQAAFMTSSGGQRMLEEPLPRIGTISRAIRALINTFVLIAIILLQLIIVAFNIGYLIFNVKLMPFATIV